ncbi:MAG: YdbC family protein [Defluviitaleaceae bacterium]|nr:YdbC family protein [Defluviitaleaceae bacterium]
MADVKYEITQHIGVLSGTDKGWQKELNLISWNGRPPKYDIRDWSQGHEKMSKGTTLSQEELQALKNLLDKIVI